MEHLAAAAATAAISGNLPPFPTRSSASHARHLLRRLLLVFLHALLRFLLSLLSFLSSFQTPKYPISNPSSPPKPSSPTARALFCILALVSAVPVSSRKYDFVRDLADRLLDENLRFAGGAEINRAALSSAFSTSLRRLESAFFSSSSPTGDGYLFGALRAGLRRWSEKEPSGGGGGLEAEKVTAEMMWMAGKMAECCAAAEAVAMWGAAAGLARLALDAEPRLQVALVRVSAFLFKHVNARRTQGAKEEEEEEEEEEEGSVARRRMAMLTSWLPLLCCASNGTGAPVLSSAEKAETARVLAETIEKLSWEEQEQVLALWLQHFSSSPNSDWPNLESCYARWYAESREIILQ